MAADLHERQSFGVVDLLSQGVVFEGCGQTRKASLRATSGHPAAAAHHDRRHPGTTVIGARRQAAEKIHE